MDLDGELHIDKPLEDLSNYYCWTITLCFCHVRWLKDLVKTWDSIPVIFLWQKVKHSMIRSSRDRVAPWLKSIRTNFSVKCNQCLRHTTQLYLHKPIAHCIFMSIFQETTDTTSLEKWNLQNLAGTVRLFQHPWNKVHICSTNQAAKESFMAVFQTQEWYSQKNTAGTKVGHFPAVI